MDFLHVFILDSNIVNIQCSVFEGESLSDIKRHEFNIRQVDFWVLAEYWDFKQTKIHSFFYTEDY